MSAEPPAAWLTGARARHWVRLGIFVTALLVRLTVQLELADLPTTTCLIEDAARYDRLAQELVAHRGVPATAFDQAPLYPYLLATVYAAAGHHVAVVRGLQAVLDAGTCVLLAALADGLLGSPCGLLAGLFAAFCGPLIFQSTLLLKETASIFALALALWSLACRPTRGRTAFCAGLALGAVALLRENFLPLLPGFALVPWRRAGLGATWNRRAYGAALLLAGELVSLAPAILFNRARSGEWLLTSSQGGMNFLIGNARGAPGTYVPLLGGSQDPDKERADARRLAAMILSAQEGAAVDPATIGPGRASAVLWRAGWREIQAAPVAWLQLLGRKFELFWNAYDIPDAEGISTARAASRTLRMAPFGFAVLVPLALAGWWLAPPGRRAAASALGALALALCASTVAFFVFARYRLPVVVCLAPLAAVGVVGLGRAMVARDRWRLAVGAAITAATAIAVARAPFSDRELRGHEAVLAFNLGSSALACAEDAEAGRLELPAAKAEQSLAEALRRATEAEAAFARSVALDPDLLESYVGGGTASHRRGHALLEAGRLAEAARAYASVDRWLRAGEARPGWAADRTVVAQAEELRIAATRNRERVLRLQGG